MPVNVDELNAAYQAQYALIEDRFTSYEARVTAREANAALINEVFYAQQGKPFIAPTLDSTAVLAPHASIGDYTVKPNSGPKSGIRPCYFLDLDLATGLVSVTIAGDIIVPAASTFSVTTSPIDPAQPMASFLAAVATDPAVVAESRLYVGVERLCTCLGVVGQVGYEIANLAVTIA